MISIIKISGANEKATIVEAVLLDLPEWFGLPESTAEYIHDSRELDLWAAKDNGEYIGFITLSQSSTDCGEIHCMGVKKAYHRKGGGTLLLAALKNFAKTTYESGVIGFQCFNQFCRLHHVKKIRAACRLIQGISCEKNS